MRNDYGKYKDFRIEINHIFNKNVRNPLKIILIENAEPIMTFKNISPNIMV